MTTIINKIVGDKRRWRDYKARTKVLPVDYRTAVDALERYIMHIGPADGDSAATMFEDLATLFEQAAADQTPIRAIVGDNPVEFIELFLQNYSNGGWMFRERARLTKAFDAIEAKESSDADNPSNARNAETRDPETHNNPPEGSDRT